MQLLWSKTIRELNPWGPEYAGVFCKIHGHVNFLYKTPKGPQVLSEIQELPKPLCPDSADVYFPLPLKWVLVEDEVPPHLFFTDNLVLNLSEMKLCDQPDEVVLEKYHTLRKPDMYYLEAPFDFGEYRISHKGYFGYQCTRNGIPAWTFKGQGYLYTDIARWNDRLYFGTAGQGGYFYILNLVTGEALTKIKTGGTVFIVRCGGVCYILHNEKHAKLLCIDLTDGSIRNEVALPGQSCKDSMLKEIDGRIHAITFEMKKSFIQHVYWNCVEI